VPESNPKVHFSIVGNIGIGLPDSGIVLYRWECLRFSLVYDTIAFYCLKSDQIVDKASSLALVVDPLEPETVLKEIENQSVSLQGVLTTHHHW
jgi:hypothetical protein